MGSYASINGAREPVLGQGDRSNEVLGLIPTPLVLVIEFARVERVDDPFAFRFEPQDYLVRAEGGGFSRIRLNWDQEWLDDLAALQRPVRPPELLQRIGERLYRFVADAGWSEQSAAVEAVHRAGGQVLISIRSAAAELYSLPWELLTVGPSGSHLAELDRVLLRYEWPESTTTPEHHSPRGTDGRMLVAWSAAAGAVPAKEHIDAIAGACAAGKRPFDRERDVLAHATPGRLERALSEALSTGPPVDVLHILCHAHGGAEGGLLLDSDDGEGITRVDPGSLRRLLRPFAGMVRLVVFAACESADPGSRGNSLGSLTQVLHRAGYAAVIGARSPLAVSSSIVFTRALYRGLSDMMMSLEEALVGARQRLAAEPGDIAWATLQLYARASDGVDTRPLVVQPYRGLLAFQPEHSRLLFGRDREVAAIHANLRELEERGSPRLVVVAGASGTGKSSVVLGGFIPSLEAEGATPWVYERLRPGAEPLKALAAAASRLRGEATSADPGSIAEALLRWCREHPAARLLLVVDQLEELFTQGGACEERAAFARLLWELPSDARASLTIIATLRVDFVGHCGELVLDDAGLRLDRVAYSDEHRVFVPRGDRRVLREIIEAPALAVGLSFETGLVERLLDDVDGEPGALPLLGHALNLLWEHRSGRVLTLAVYRQIGELSGALGRHADSVITALSPEEQTQARRLLVRLLSTADGNGRSDTRSRLRLSQLRPSGEAAAIYDRVAQGLTASRLVVISESEGSADAPSEPMIEVSHEALFRGWPRLQRWIAEDHERLLDISRLDAWLVDFYERGTILDDARLGFAVQIAAQYPDDVSDDVRGLVEASVSARDERRGLEAARRVELERSLFTARKNATLVGLLALVSLLFGILAADVVDELELESQRRVDDPLFSILEELPVDDYRNRLAVLSLVAAPHNRVEWVVAANETLATLPEQRVLGTLEESGPFADVQLSADGRWALLRARQSVAAYDLRDDDVWDHLEATSVAALEGDAEFRSAIFGGEDSALLLRDDDVLMVWDPGSPRPMKANRRGLSVPTAVLANHGRQLAFADEDRITIVDVRDPQGDRELTLDGAPVDQLLFADAGTSLLGISSAARTIRLWYLDRDAPPITFSVPVGKVISASLAGGEIRAVTDRGALLAWSPERPESLPRVVDLGRSPVRIAAINPLGTGVALVTDDYFGIESFEGRPSLPLPGLSGPILSASWSPSGDRVFAIDRQNLRVFWADGRRFNFSGASPMEHVATVWQLTECLDQGELRALFNRFEVGDLLRTIEPGRCLDNQRHRERTTQEISATTLLLLIFLLEFGLLVSRVLWARRYAGLVLDRAAVKARIPALALTLTALVASYQILDSSLARGVGSELAGLFLLSMLGAAWFIRGAFRMHRGALRASRAARIGFRLVQGVGLTVGVTLSILALTRMGTIIAQLDLYDGFGIHEATKAMFVLIVVLLTLMFTVSLANADKAHTGAGPDNPEELPKALQLLRERGLRRLKELSEESSTEES